MTTKEVKYTIGAMKNATQKMQNERQLIEEGKNVCDNIQNLQQTFETIGSHMKGQLNYIQNFQTSVHTNKANKDEAMMVENKRWLEKFLEISKEQMIAFIDTVKINFCANKQEKKESTAWEKVLLSVEKFFSKKQEKLSGNMNYFEIVYEVMNVKETLIIKVLEALLYKKIMLWRDMNMKMEDFVPSLIKKIFDWVKSNQQKYGGYIPIKPEFKEISFEEEKPYCFNLNRIQEDSSKEKLPYIGLAKTLELFSIHYEEIIDALRNYSKLNDVQEVIEDVNQNKKTVKSLREKIQVLHENYQTLQQRYFEVQANIRTNDQNESKLLLDKIDEMKLQIQRKDLEIEELRKNSQGSITRIQNLNDKLKEIEDENKQMNQMYLPKLRELENLQNSINDEFTKLKKDIDTYAMLFKMESQMRTKLIKEKDFMEDRVQKLVGMIGNQRIKCKEQRIKVNQKEDALMEILVSRNELEEEVIQLKEQTKQLDEDNRMQAKDTNFSKQQMEKMKNEYEQTFQANNHLNKRIHELEDHKMKLLDLLKKNNINTEATLFTDLDIPKPSGKSISIEKLQSNKESSPPRGNTIGVN